MNERRAFTNYFKPSLITRPALAAGAMLILSVLSGCSKSEPAAPIEVEVQAGTVAREAITQHIAADAVLFPVAQAAISPKLTAPVKKFYVQRGSKVKAGQLLATLENRDLEAAVIDNRGAFDAAQAGYETAVKAQIPEDYQKAELDLTEAKANLDLNMKIVASRKQLFEQGALPGRDLDSAQAALVQAKAAYDAAEKHFTAMQHVSREAAIQSAKGQLESARGKYQGAEAQQNYSEIRSPISGVVTDRPLYPGETAAAGMPLVTVMDTSAMLAKLHLPQSQAQILKTGDPAVIQVPGLEKPVAGKISLISPALDPGSTTVEIWVRMENPDGQLRPGTAVHLTLAGKRVPEATVVPAQAIIATSNGKKAVLVIGSDGTVHQKEVETGIEDDGKVQVLSGITAGQPIVITGAYGLDEGTKVRVTISAQGDATDESAKPSDSGENQ